MISLVKLMIAIRVWAIRGKRDRLLIYGKSAHSLTKQLLLE
jgi:hypothetical protein